MLQHDEERIRNDRQTRSDEAPTFSLRSFMSAGDHDDNADDGEEEFDLAAQEKQDDLFLTGHDEGDLEESDPGPQLDLIERWKSRRSIYREDYPRSVEVMQQALCYLGAFYLTHVWSTSNRIVQFLNHGSTSFGLILMHSWFDPFQGFLNYLVYQRPRYLKIRKFCPDLSRWEAFKRTMQLSYSPPTQPEDSRRDTIIAAAISHISHPRAGGDAGFRASAMPSIFEDKSNKTAKTSVEDVSIRKSVQWLAGAEVKPIAPYDETETGSTMEDDTCCDDNDGIGSDRIPEKDQEHVTRKHITMDKMMRVDECSNSINGDDHIMNNGGVGFDSESMEV